MRKTLLFLLLASTAVPSFAADQNDDRAARREAARAERAERAEARAERAERSEARPERAERQVERAAPAPQAERSDRDAARAQRRAAIEQRLIDQGARADDRRRVRPALEQRGETADSVRDWRRQERERLRATRPAAIEPLERDARRTIEQRREQRIARRDTISNRRPPVVSRVPREGTQPPPPATVRPAVVNTSHWRNRWRSDRRYDWWSHRNRHRSLFHLGFYFDPFGWGYRPYSIGWRMWPSYYRSNYWLNDPWQYRLPYAPPGYRWIRYHDDAVLVDTWDGQVVDVIYNFFW